MNATIPARNLKPGDRVLIDALAPDFTLTRHPDTVATVTSLRNGRYTITFASGRTDHTHGGSTYLPDPEDAS